MVIHFNLCYEVYIKWYFTVVLLCISLVISGVLIWPYEFFLEKSLYSFDHFVHHLKGIHIDLWKVF